MNLKCSTSDIACVGFSLGDEGEERDDWMFKRQHPSSLPPCPVSFRYPASSLSRVYRAICAIKLAPTTLAEVLARIRGNSTLGDQTEAAQRDVPWTSAKAANEA